MKDSTSLPTVLHFQDSFDTSGYFPQLAKWHDRTRFRMLFGTLRAMEPGLRSYMEGESVPCISLDSRSRLDYAPALPRLVAVLRKEQVTILHTHLFDPSVVGLLAGALASTPVRLLTRHYSDYHTRIDKRWHVALDRGCTWLAHAVIAVSQHTRDHMLERERAPADKVKVILNGVDFARLRPSHPESVQRIRRELGATDSKLILVLARLHPEKGHTFLFRALPGLAERFGGRVVLAVAGTGPFEDAYRAEVQALGCAGITRFLGFRRDAPDLIRAADVVVLPSVAEAFGLVLVEAQYLGAAIVATRVGGVPEIIADGANGLLVPPGEVAPLEQTIARVLEDDSLRARLSIAGPLNASRFSFESMVRSYEQLYDELLEARSRH